MRGLFCLLRFLLSFPAYPPLCSHGYAFCAGPRTHRGTDPGSDRPISSAARERSCLDPAYRTGSARARLGSQCARLSGSYLELVALLPSFSDWSQSRLGIEGLQLVETPAKKSADDRDRYQRNRAWTGHAVRIRQIG